MNEVERFEVKIYDHYLSNTVPIETKYEKTFKKALKSAIEIMFIDLSADCITIYDIDKEKPRADLVWNKDKCIIEARSLKDDKKILASGEEADILAHYLRH